MGTQDGDQHRRDGHGPDRAAGPGASVAVPRTAYRRLPTHIPVSSALLISKLYDERRAYATARKLWPEIRMGERVHPMTLPEYVDSIGDAHLVIDMLVGAQQRLAVCPQQGFMIEQALPDDVLAAYERLRGDGFTSRLVPETADRA